MGDSATKVRLKTGEQEFELVFSRSPQETVADMINTANRFFSLPYADGQQEKRMHSRKGQQQCQLQCA